MKNPNSGNLIYSSRKVKARGRSVLNSAFPALYIGLDSHCDWLSLIPSFLPQFSLVEFEFAARGFISLASFSREISLVKGWMIGWWCEPGSWTWSVWMVRDQERRLQLWKWMERRKGIFSFISSELSLLYLATKRWRFTELDLTRTNHSRSSNQNNSNSSNSAARTTVVNRC